ncbi:MAG TPA: amidohydrolase family protein [Stellaceae bacterium]|jgi:predicted TIM-barrel fold metal-dependent hydrolase|nr:amidohydrolase family protein [Stellaceae bacterium]
MAPRIIDTHHHIYPTRYVAQNLQRLLDDATLLPASAYQNWSPSIALEQMDKAGIETAITSITSPGVWFEGDKPADNRARARDCNEFGATMMRDHPKRFGMFGAIPVPDTEGSLAEIAHIFDVLKLDGVGVLTSYAGQLLGDPAFDPVFDELNRRKAKVFVHPTMSCCGNVFPGVSGPTIEFPTDSARAIASLLLRGTFARCPNITFLFSHGGGTLPSIVQRVLGSVRHMSDAERARFVPNGAEYELQRQYYDVASVAMNPAGMAAVLKLWPSTQITYGSDAPFASTTGIVEALAKLDLAPALLQAIHRDNALRLFPRFG